VFKKLSELKIGDIIVYNKTQTIGECAKPYCYFNAHNEFYEKQRDVIVAVIHFVVDPIVKNVVYGIIVHMLSIMVMKCIQQE
jgi:hypothetical protein